MCQNLLARVNCVTPFNALSIFFRTLAHTHIACSIQYHSRYIMAFANESLRVQLCAASNLVALDCFVTLTSVLSLIMKLSSAGLSINC